MSAAATMKSEATSAPSDEALIAEITPAMLTKLKADSRQQAISQGFVFMFLAVFVFPNFAKQFDGWLGVSAILLALAFFIFAVVTMFRSFFGQPSVLRDELAYRRRHGKWRWER